MPAKKPASFNFEQSLGNLESIVKKMEAGDLSLEQSLTQFEEGMKLAAQCQEALTTAEQKVEVLVSAAAQRYTTEPFYEEEDDDDA